MRTAEEYRAEISRLKNAVLTQGRSAVNNGAISEQNFQNFIQAIGVTEEDPQTREAREELEAFQLLLQKATRTFLPRGSRDEALRLIGCPVPTGRVGTL